MLSFSGSSEAVVVDFAAGQTAKAVRILPLGDSITYGYVSFEDPVAPGYRGPLYDKLSAAGLLVDFVGDMRTGPDALLDRDHQGKPGQRADELIGLLPGIIDTQKPDVVLLMTGTNDVLQQGNGQQPDALSTVPGEIRQILDIISARQPGALIMVSTLPPLATGTTTIPPLNDAIRKLVADAKAQGLNVRLVEPNLTSADLASDRIHPSPAGYEKLSQTWYSALTAALPAVAGTLGGTPTSIAASETGAIGSNGNDALLGDARANNLQGGNGNDILEGRGGNDTLTGGAGFDIFRFAAGFGADTITDFQGGAGMGDVLRFNGVFADEAALRAAAQQVGADVVISAGADKITLKNVQLSNLRSDDFMFSGGGNTEPPPPEPPPPTGAITGTAGHDKLTADNGNNVIYGLDGSDKLYGYGGYDQLFGGTGDDQLYGGGDGDLLDGGAGNDVLVGGNGPDTFVFAAGFGRDLITDFQAAAGDVLRFEGVFANEAAVRAAAQQVGADVVITAGSSTISMANVQLSGLTSANFAFSGGTSEPEPPPPPPPPPPPSEPPPPTGAITGTDGNNKLTANNEANVIYGLAGYDSLYGYGGNDQLYGGADGDHLYGGGDNDLLDGGTGDDVLVGGGGADTFVFAAGFGRDVVTDFQAGAGVGDVLRFQGLFANEAAVRAAAQQVGSDVVITAGADAVTLIGVQLTNLHSDDFLLS